MSTVEEVEDTVTAPAAAVVPPIASVPAAVTPVLVTLTEEPPLIVSAFAIAEEDAVTAVVAAAVIACVPEPTEVAFKAVKPVQEVLLTLTVAPLVRFAVSMFVTVAAVGVVTAALLTTFKTSVPAPPFKASPVVQTAAPATSEAVKVSLAVPPVKLSAPVVSVIASYSAISL